MSVNDITRLLILITALDGRLNPPSSEDAKARVMAWAMVLDSDMPMDAAEQIVRRHYADSTKAIMPADINLAWRFMRIERKREQRAELESRQQEEADAAAIPMPAGFRDAIKRLEAGTVIDHG